VLLCVSATLHATKLSIATVCSCLVCYAVQFEDTVVYRGKGKQGKAHTSTKGRTSSNGANTQQQQQQQQGAYASVTEMLQVHTTVYTIYGTYHICQCL
jgi:hypothetical protein